VTYLRAFLYGGNPCAIFSFGQSTLTFSGCIDRGVIPRAPRHLDLLFHSWRAAPFHVSFWALKNSLVRDNKDTEQPKILVAAGRVR